MKFKFHLFCILCIPFFFSCGEDDKTAPVKVEYGHSKLEYEARVKWLKEAKLGVIIHFGPGTVTGEEISWCRISDRGDGSDPYESYFGPVTHKPEEYDSLYKEFNPTQFDANQWIDLFQSSGFKYFLFVSKHHDGFCNFDTEHAWNDYKITHPNCPYGKDISLELAEASKAKGLRYGFYYSVPDWKDPDFMKATHSNYIERMEGQIEELISEKYSPDLMFFDSRFPAEYFNGENIIEKIWERHPDMIINDRCLYKGDYETPEGYTYTFNNSRTWMTLYQLGRHWSFVEDDVLQTTDRLLINLSNIICNDGIFTLGIGPKPDGSIDSDHAQRILDVGKWLEKYGESIYETNGGPYANFPQAGATYKGKYLYLHVRDWGTNPLELPKLDANVQGFDVLNSSNEFSIGASGESLVITRNSNNEVDGPFEIIRLELDKEVKKIPTIWFKE